MHRQSKSNGDASGFSLFTDILVFRFVVADSRHVLCNNRLLFLLFPFTRRVENATKNTQPIYFWKADVTTLTQTTRQCRTMTAHKRRRHRSAFWPSLRFRRWWMSASSVSKRSEVFMYERRFEWWQWKFVGKEWDIFCRCAFSPTSNRIKR